MSPSCFERFAMKVAYLPMWREAGKDGLIGFLQYLTTYRKIALTICRTILYEQELVEL
jgi:hypothetical protein